MATQAPSKPGSAKGKGLNGKIGPVPVKVAIFLVALVAGYLLFRHFKGSTTTSAGSNATPDPSQTIPLGAGSGTGSGDSTGGGASGLEAPDLANLFSQFLDTLGTVAGGQGTAQPQPIQVFLPSSGANVDSPQGGNTSDSAVPQASKPASSQPAVSKALTAAQGYKAAVQSQTLTSQILQQAGGVGGGGSSPGSGASPINVPGTVSGTYMPGTPFSNAAAKIVSNPTIAANKTGGSANKKQGVYAIH